MPKLADKCTEIGWSLRFLAQQVGVNDRTARRWDAEDSCPPNILEWLSAVVTLIRAVPKPRVEMGRRPAAPAQPRAAQPRRAPAGKATPRR